MINPLIVSLFLMCVGCSTDPRPDLLEVTEGSSQEERAKRAIEIAQQLIEEGFPTTPCEPGTTVDPDNEDEITAFDLLIVPTIDNDGTVYLQCSISDTDRYDYILEKCREQVLAKL